MKLSTWTLALAIGAVAAFAATNLTAQDAAHGEHAGHNHAEPAQDAGMQMPPEFSPGPNHKLLDPFVGEWNAAMKFWMAPGAAPQESKATSSAKWALDGRWVIEEFNGEFDGMPFKGISTTGYDPFKKKFISTWIDSMSTTMMVMEGAADPAGKTFGYVSKGFDPMVGAETTTKTIITVDSHDQHTMKMYMIMPDGVETQTMEVVYTRTK